MSKAYRNSMLFCWAIRTPADTAEAYMWGPGFFGRGNDIDYSLSPLGVPVLFSTRAKADAYLRDYVIPHRQGRRDCRVVRVQVRESVIEVDAFPARPRDRSDIHCSHSLKRRKT